MGREHPSLPFDLDGAIDRVRSQARHWDHRGNTSSSSSWMSKLIFVRTVSANARRAAKKKSTSRPTTTAGCYARRSPCSAPDHCWRRHRVRSARSRRRQALRPRVQRAVRWPSIRVHREQCQNPVNGMGS